MDFLNENGELDLELISATDYSAFHGKFHEEIDPHLANIILDDNSTSKVPDMEYVEVNGDWITQQKRNKAGEELWVMENGVELEIPRFTLESKKLLKKRIGLLKNGNQLEIIYHQKKGIGRFYSHDDLSLTCLARNIRNTIYAYNSWVDYDFVASHPSVLSAIAVKMRIKTPKINEYVRDKRPIVKMLSDHHSVAGEPPLQKDHIKKLINASLYGGGLTGWATGGEKEDFDAGILKGNASKNEMPMKVKNYAKYDEGHTWWKAFKQEIKTITKKLIGANTVLKDRVAPLSLGLPDWKRNAKTMSYILGAFENDCLYHSYQYGLENELIRPRSIALAYDGFTSAPCEHAYNDASYHINGVNDYIFEKTGINIRMEIKSFEDWTVQKDLIKKRREMVIADVINSFTEEALTLATSFEEGDEGNEYSQQYLLWKTNHEQKHTKIIDTNNYFKKLIEIDELGNENFIGYKIFNRADLVGAYEHEWYYRSCPRTGKSKKSKYIDEWLSDRNIQRKDKTDILPPPLYCPPTVLNLWKPSEYEGRVITPENDRYNKDAVDIWLNHIGIICDHDAAATEYVINWFAHLLQKPAEKPETCIVITGEEGVGKTIMLNPIKKIMGGGYFESSNPERDVWGNFNPIMSSTLLIVLSEVDKRNAFGFEGKIKALKTDKEITIRDLHKSPYTIHSHHRFIIPTNHPDPVSLSKGQRRDMIIKTSAEKKGDFEYFTNFTALWNIEDNLISLYSYLMDRPIGGWNFRTIPKTDYQIVLEEYSRPVLDIFFEYWIARQVTHKESVDDDGFISKLGSEMFVEWRNWKAKNGGSFDVSGAGDLIKKLNITLNLPKGSILKGVRTSSGQRTKFHIDELKKHYKIGECLIVLDEEDDEDVNNI